jgi:pimeloyl-ACP methyl ester carboxylesterase
MPLTTIEMRMQQLPHGIGLSLRTCGERGCPVLMFLHGFPEAAFVWDEYLVHFAKPENGGYRCIAPNLRGFEHSSSPKEVSAYRAKFIVQDIAALIESEVGKEGQLACLIAHDWGGAVAWNLVNQLPHLQKKLCIINSPHPGTFLRELQNSSEQQASSLYMNFLSRPDAPAILAEDNFRRLWKFFTNMGAGADQYGWLTNKVRAQYQEVWDMGLTGACNYYAASPMQPATNESPAISSLTLPKKMFAIKIPTQVIWGMGDTALRPALLIGLDEYIADLRIHKVDDATHWITHERPALLKQLITHFIA